MTTHFLLDLQTSILLARRAKYLSICLWLSIVVVALVLMAAQFSGRQPATVALDVGLSAMRLLIPFLIIHLSQELVSREFDRRYYLNTLAYPRPRHQMLLARLAATLILVYLLMLFMSIVLAWTTATIAEGYEQLTPVDLGRAYWLTILFMAVDFFILTSMSIFLATVASTPSFVLIGTLGFLLVARSYSNIINLLENNRYLLENSELYQNSLNVLYYILPDLAALDVRMISLYGKPELLPTDWPAILASNLMYGVALIAITLFIFQRKRFT